MKRGIASIAAAGVVVGGLALAPGQASAAPETTRSVLSATPVPSAAAAGGGQTASRVALVSPAAVVGVTTISGWSTGSISAAVGYRLPFRVGVKVSTRPSVSRLVSVQAMPPGATTWRQVAAVRTGSTGIAVGTLPVSRLGTWRFRLVVPATTTARATATSARRIVGVLGRPSTLKGWTSATMSVTAAKSRLVALQVAPAASTARRTVQVQSKTATAMMWKVVTTRTSDALGRLAVPVTAPKTGYLLVRVVVLPSLANAGLTGAVRRVAAAAPAAPAGLTAEVGATTIALRWQPGDLANIASYRVVSAPSESGPWSVVTTTLPVSGATQQTTLPVPTGGNSWFSVSALDAYGNLGRQALPIGVTSVIASSSSTATVAARGFALEVPPNTITGSTARISVVSMPSGIDGLETAALHIDGAWSGSVKVSAPWVGAAGTQPVLLHDAADGLRISTGSGLTTTGVPGSGTVTATVSSLSDFTATDAVCPPTGSTEPLPYNCGDKNDQLFSEWWNARAEELANAIVPSNFTTCTDGPAGYARMVGFMPSGMTCSWTTDATTKEATYTLKNESEKKFGFWSSAVVQRYSINPNDVAPGNSILGEGTVTVPADTPQLLDGFIKLTAGRALVPGATISFRKPFGFDESRISLGSDVTATVTWLGVQEMLSLMGDSLLAQGDLNSAISAQLLECTTTGLDESVRECFKSALKKGIDKTLETGGAVWKGKIGASARVAAKALKYIDFAVLAVTVARALQDQQTGAAIFLRNSAGIAPPTGRGGTDYIARSPASGRAVWVSGGTIANIPDGATFNCLAASRVVWDIGQLADLDRVPATQAKCPAGGSAWTFTPSSVGGNTGTDVILRSAAGNAWLVNHWGDIQWIPDGGTYLCLAHANPILWNAPDSKINTWVPRGALAATCGSSPAPARSMWGTVVAADDGSSWYVDLRGGRHWVPDGGTFGCLANQGVPVIRNASRTTVNTLTQYENAACVSAADGNVVRHNDGDAYLLDAGKLRSITNGETFECLVGNQARTLVNGVPRYWILDHATLPSITLSCFDKAASRGKVVRTPIGTSYYVDLRGGRHWIPDGGVYNCLIAQGKALVDRVPQFYLDQMPQYENAACVQAAPGNVIRHSDGDAYLINGDGTRSWIPTSAAYQCILATRTLVNNVPRYYIDDMVRVGDASVATGNCIVRRSDGTAYFVNNQGVKEWIPDTVTWWCETGRGVPVINAPDGFVNALPETGWHYCLNKSSLWGKMLRHTDGDVSFVHPDNTRTWVPDEFTYNCRARQGVAVVDTRWREYVNAFTYTGWDYCFDVEAFKGRHIAHPDGDHHIVGGDGRRHWVPADRLACINNRYGAAATVRWREYINAMPEGDWAICGDTLYRNQNMDRGQWLASGDGRYKLHMQTDGNLVLYNSAGRAIWATNVGGRHLKLHNDGCLAEVDYSGNWVWQTGCNRGGDHLVVQSDGNLVLYAGGTAVWASNTVGR